MRLTVTDDLRRSRLTVFFRLLLGIPHFIWWTLWTIARCWRPWRTGSRRCSQGGFRPSLDCLRHGGRVVAYGFTAGIQGQNEPVDDPEATLGATSLPLLDLRTRTVTIPRPPLRVPALNR